MNTKSTKHLFFRVFLPLKNKNDPLCPTVFLLGGGIYDPSLISHEDVMKTNIMLMDLEMVDDHSSIINGLHIVQDMGKTTMGHIAPLSLTKKAMTIFQHTYPNRPKGMHMFNLPSFFDMVFNMIKPFLTEKMKSRVRSIIYYFKYSQ